MRLTFLGTGGYHPSERRHTACVMLPQAGVVLDAGTGFFRVQERLQTEELDVFLTHAHLDHVVGITFFIVPVLRGDVKTVRIHGTADTIRACRKHLLANRLFPVEPSYQWCELGADARIPLPDDGLLTWRSVDHPGGAVGYRLDWPDRSLAYITDTTAPGNYLDFIDGVDVLIHECYFPDEMADWARKTGHSSASAVAQLAADAGVGRLLLVHTDPQTCADDPVGLEGMRKLFPNTEMAEDLQELQF
ncbi:MAG: MBL fold metallo-hydrolase [Planctomycetaceae bacterium]|jgi:ribonuclease Z